LTISTKKSGRPIKPLHAVNGGPLTFNLTIDATERFREAGIPYARLHDIEYPMGSGEFVDIHCVFPDFDADPESPESYNFTCTDLYIKAIIESGCQPFYRLGESIDHGPLKKYINPPEDFTKWARICEGIIRHYNKGWADGYQYGIRYWEIWNEPENPPMWNGTREEYIKLYEIAANHIKSCFPEIKVGGYSSSGFYAVTRSNVSDSLKSRISYFDDFLSYISNPETKAPLDFFSWHIYNTDPDEVVAHARYIEERLKDNGFGNAESILNEWNYNGPDMFRSMRRMEGAFHVAGVLCELQSAPVDMAMYYDAQPRQRYGGLFKWYSPTPAKPFYALQAFGSLYKLGNESVSSYSGNRLRYCAATDEDDIAVMLNGPESGDSEVTVNIKGMSGNKKLTAYILDDQRNLEPQYEYKEHTFKIKLKEKSMVLLKST
ncbi:MAG: hypothetical protein R3232_12330, partial [Clostridia bacterium]|nr:hypothetical protein [Clostridia bacterium]